MAVMPLDLIFPNPDQPRKEFSERKLEELAQSIRANGLLEPIVVTPRAGRFMIIAYKSLMDLSLSMEEVARKMGFKQTWRVRYRLDLLRLHPIYQRYPGG